MLSFFRKLMGKGDDYINQVQVTKITQSDSIQSTSEEGKNSWQERAASVGALIQNGEKPSYTPIGLTTLSPEKSKVVKIQLPGPPPDKNASKEAQDAWKHQARMLRVQESEEASNRYEQRVMYMHFSALSPTTRKSHADRHGKLFTAEEIEDFWADPENQEGCKCSVISVLVDESGEPLVDAIVKRAQNAYEKMKKRGYDWSK